MRLQTVSLLLLMSILWVQRAVAQYVQTNPLEWMALAEGNEAINGEIESQTDGQLRTAALQNTIAAEFNKIQQLPANGQRVCFLAESRHHVV